MAMCGYIILHLVFASADISDRKKMPAEKYHIYEQYVISSQVHAYTYREEQNKLVKRVQSTTTESDIGYGVHDSSKFRSLQ